jgi:hypothetical protein
MMIAQRVSQKAVLYNHRIKGKEKRKVYRRY